RLVSAELAAGRPVCLGARFDEATGKLIGVSVADVALLRERLGATVILVEADGSAGRPLKAPAAHEPVIPPCADLVVPVAGAGVLGQLLDGEHVHRPALVAAAAGVTEGSVVTPAVVAAALAACTRGAPAEARVVPVLGQADLPGVCAGLRETAGLLCGAGVGRVVLAAPRSDQPVRDVVGTVAVVVLAGGAGRRFGSNKLVHPWGDVTVLEASLRAPLRAGLAEVVVVTGAYHAELAARLARYPVRVIPNPDWQEGMSTTLRAGLGAVGDPAVGNLAAVLVCLGDMPRLPAEVLTELVRAHARSGAPVVAPEAGGLRRNPVLFDRSLVRELTEARGDEGGRSVVRRHQQEMLLVSFPDPSCFGDVDSRDDLRNV
ncbi:MAG: MoeA-like protein, partial [Firmicutes bacterium]|nr:MoeA-like protein [Bacillota bacterium]